MTRGGDIRFLMTRFSTYLSQGRHHSARHLCTQLRSGAVSRIQAVRSMSHTQHSRRLVGEMVFTRNNDNTG